ncbi:hypothetical protein SFRURICE_010366 [Spodoptera frugiperda]|nr:hypothetical protein SFRURICE_010366 [Spodoptera frugiperda]
MGTMEGFCRGCLIKYNDPMELLQYTEKYRRLFVYSTGIQVKRNDTFTFQLCRDCFLNMKQACKFKKQCRTTDKQFKNYKALKDVGDPIDFCTFLKNCDDALTFRLPLASGSSTPATQKRDDDNESTCTSIRNFMTDILQGEEMPDTEARIIREVIEEEADVLEDSLDSHWLQDDVFSPFSTPRSVNNDHCYTPKKYVEQKEEQISFETVNTEKQTKILNDFTKAFQNDENIKESESFENKVMEEPESFKSLYPFEADEPIVHVDPVKSTEEPYKPNTKNIKEITSFAIKEISTKEIALKRTFANKNLKELCDFSLDSPIEKPDSNKNDSLKELCDATLNEFGEVKSVNNAKNEDKVINDFSIDEIDGLDKSVSNLDLPSLDYSDKDRTSAMNFYTENMGSVKSVAEMSNSSINIEALLKDKPCTIDRNLEEALKNPDNKEFSLDELLISPPEFQKTSAASTPTIRNILFNVKYGISDTDVNTNKKIGQCIEPYDNVQGDIEIFEEFFQNDTKEFDIDDIKRAYVDTKGQWKRNLQPIGIKVENGDSNDMDFETAIHNENRQIDNKEEIIPTVEESEVNKKSYCESCNKEYKNARALNIHLAKIHGLAKKKVLNNKSSKILCTQCGLETTDTSNFKRHLKVCGKPKAKYDCECCGESFTSQSKLKKHKRAHSANPRQKSQNQYICSICNAIMHKRNNFILHIRRHEKNYSIRCKECGRGFYRASDLTAHMRF